MKLCQLCDHYVLNTEASCPFCGASVSTMRAPLAPLGLAFGLMTAACGPSTGSESEAGSAESSGSSGGTTPITATTATPTTTTTSMTTMGPEGTSSTTTSVDESSDDQGGSFYAGPTDIPTTELCDLQAQDCLPGEKCSPWSVDGDHIHDSSRCVPVADNPGQSGEPCQVEGSHYSGFDDCDVGLVCADVAPGTDTGVCRAICDPDGEKFCADPNTVCIGWYDGAFPICSAACDPVLMDCRPGLGCYGNPDTVCDFGACGYPPPPRTALSQGEVCSELFVNECEAGLQCTDGSLVLGCAGARCCTATCDLSDATSCDAIPGTVCGVSYPPDSCLPKLYFAGVCVAQ
ncbi:MAG: hypothetical protein AAGF11_17985 [Myxococcota bacterium]